MTNAVVSQLAKAGLDRTQTDLILEVTRRFTSTLKLNEVLGQVLSLTVDAIGAERGSIFVMDRSGQVTHKILARWYLPPHQSQEVVSAVLNQGAAGYVFRHRQAVLIKDTEADERWVHLPDDPNVTRSALGVPLLFQDRLNGVLTLTHAQPNRFDEDDLDLVRNIAGQAAIAIENACLFDRVRQERATLHAVISGVTEGILITDTYGQVLYANPAGAAALGVNAVAVRGQALKDVVPDQRLSELLGALLSDGEPQRGEICSNDGRAFDASLVLLPGTGVVMTLHDVTHFKELDTLKSEFVTTVSHDLKSPLGLIYGYAWILAELPTLDAEAQGHVRIIIDEVQKMQQMINSLLDLTMIESGIDRVQEPVDLVELAKKGLAAFQVQAKAKDLELVVQTSPALPQIQGHSVRLGQAINNLISNAVKFSPPGGRITVSVECDEDEVRVWISDDGPGIPAAKQTGLFQKFYKVGARETWSKEGHGLGLAIVRSVAEAHSGRVEVKSVKGQGATFGIILPLAPAVDASDSAAHTRLAVP